MNDSKKAEERVETDPATVDPPMPQWASQALLDVAAERRRHIEVEGWVTEHDDEHDTGELASAAAAYAEASPMAGEVGAEYGPGDPPESWPWEDDAWKPTGQRRMLVKAGALILAEIERLDRKAFHTNSLQGLGSPE